MTEKRMVSAFTLLTSLAGYFYAKHIEKDTLPIVMISGFFGAMLGETVYRILSEEDNNDRNPPAAMV
jgi:uncharacterized membrane protein YfcA